jgi:hypothetical protein
MKIVGFTGTHFGRTKDQKYAVQSWLINHMRPGVNLFLHGDCVGSDIESASDAREVGYRIMGFPPINEYRRGFFPNDHTWPAKDFLERDRDIVDQSQVMLATPHESYEIVRSGTWHTIRYALKIGKEIHVINSNGKITVHQAKT